MKIFYNSFLSVAFALIIASASFAQNRASQAKNISSLGYAKSNPVHTLTALDTLTNHWDLIGPTAIDTPTLLFNVGSGYVAGQNGYGDKAQAQKFDPTYGVTSGGTINSILFWFGGKMVGAGTASFTATIWADNAGKPGAVLGTAPAFSITSIDTAVASLMTIGQPSTALEGDYNVTATFGTPVVIPANKIFWAGMSYTYANGDSAGLVTSSDGPSGDGPGLSGNFPDASTHTFQQLSDNSWQSYNDGTGHAGNTWADDIALALYPVVDFGTGVNEHAGIVASLSNMPNPAKDATTINYDLKEVSDVSVSVLDITGKQLFSLNQGVQHAGAHSVKINISELPDGMYFYSLRAGSSVSTQKLIIVR
jgi:hypothetical protein